ncbi:unnamed protein product, partial [Mesorhabditis belari]|uniref:Phospholipase B-like n=1 Tax=Mesorhabditis belari TaxID=2138241 RepID=A0AAF3FMW9_9BILA
MAKFLYPITGALLIYVILGYFSQIDVKHLGNVEDGHEFVINKEQGHQIKYERFEICQDFNDYSIFHADKYRCYNPIATAFFKNSINTTGWSFLEIETSAKYDPKVQAYAAGYLEGVLTRRLIEHHIHNVMSTYCIGRVDYCRKLREFMDENHKWTKEFLAETDPEDAYYSAIHRTYYQLQGVIDAFERRPINPRADFEFHDIVFMNWLGEFYDLSAKFNATTRVDRVEKCSAMLKLAPDNKDLFFSHVVWFAFHHMLRVIKLYKFGYDREKFPGYAVSYTGYPGILNSQDDFQVTSAKLAIMETTISLYNASKMEHTKAVGQFPCWIRSIVASQLAWTAKDWVEIFIRHHMGTYNNHWMIADYKLFTPGQPLRDETFYVLETMPGFWIYKDKSEDLQKNTYHASYNLPQFPEIIEYSGLEGHAKNFDPAGNGRIGGDYYRSFKAPRARIFARDHVKAIDFESFTKVLRSNDPINEEFAKCECENGYSVSAAISARGDLGVANGTYECYDLGQRNMGALDYKGIDHHRMESMSYRAWGAPPFDDVYPPFEWKTFEKNSNYRLHHRGHPEKFDFDFVEINWKTNIWD